VISSGPGQNALRGLSANRATSRRGVRYLDILFSWAKRGNLAVLRALTSDDKDPLLAGADAPFGFTNWNSPFNGFSLVGNVPLGYSPVAGAALSTAPKVTPVWNQVRRPELLHADLLLPRGS
jgi:hypothetical protein